MRLLAALLLLAPAAAWVGAAQAQNMYRCGKTYQDRPCAAGQTGKVVGRAAGSAPAAQASGVPAECVQMGKDSLKIVWSREGGATQERLLADARTAAERRLVLDVYRRPGAASHVQAAVEADCVVAKAKAEEDAAIALAAALKAQREGKLPPAAAGEPAPAAPAASPRIPIQEAKRDCAGFERQAEALRADERRGGSARVMEQLSDRRRSLQSQRSAAGC